MPSYQVDLAVSHNGGPAKTVPLRIERETRNDAWEALFALCDDLEERIGKGWGFTAYSDSDDPNPNALGMLVPPKGKVLRPDEMQGLKRVPPQAKLVHSQP
ncbi:MAG: hypothetical protein ACJ789_19775 [Thermomicrobiales bacterium]